MAASLQIKEPQTTRNTLKNGHTYSSLPLRVFRVVRG